MISKLREPVNGLTHMGGAFAAVIGLIILLNTAATGVTKLISVLIYGVIQSIQRAVWSRLLWPDVFKSHPQHSQS